MAKVVLAQRAMPGTNIRLRGLIFRLPKLDSDGRG